MATYNNIKKIKIGDNIFNLYDSGNSGGTITGITTTAGSHTIVNETSGIVSFNVPTKTSHLTNDSGFITSDSDEKLAITDLTSNSWYNILLGTSTTTAAKRQYDSYGSLQYYRTYSGSSVNDATLVVGNNLNSSDSKNEKGNLRLYGSGSYWVQLYPASLSANRQISIPDKAGTIALTSDIPTQTSALTNDSGFITTAAQIIRW